MAGAAERQQDPLEGGRGDVSRQVPIEGGSDR
jgi:hypothetical protein